MTIRKQMRAKRRALTDDTRRQAAEQFAWHFSRTKHYRNSKRLACYLSNDGELDLQPLIQRAWQDKKHVYLPVLHAPYIDRLYFARYTQDSVLDANRFGIGEPAVAANRRVSPIFLDLVLTPLVAFDQQGNRIGMGGGFYDRSFSFLRRRQHWRKPTLVGCAYQFQEVDNIDANEWDVPLHSIATEYGLLQSKRH